MTPSWLHRFAVLTALATLVLIGAGGLVTSHGAGLAVPDWPNTYGYNMFFFPVSHWVGGIFYEHTHRLIASGVGLLTAILAVWLHGRNARPLLRWGGLALLLAGCVTALAVAGHRADGLVLGVTGLAALGASFTWPRCAPRPRWLRRLGLAAFVAVVLQGVLGGLRVVLLRDQIGIFHATLAQLFFVLLCALALFTSRWWEESTNESGTRTFKATGNPSAGNGARASAVEASPARLRKARVVSFLLLGTTLLVLAQLILGATMRQQHAGLAIPDFPLAYGKLWPDMDAASIARYNEQRLEVVAVKPITAAQVGMQMAHRLMALLILAAVAACAWTARRRLGRKDPVSRVALLWVGLIFVQASLGAATIWSNKAADIATAHVLTGALSLALGAILSMVSFREFLLARTCANSPVTWKTAPSSVYGPRPLPAAGLD